MVVASAAGALPMLAIAMMSSTFVREGSIPALSVIATFTAITVAVAIRSGRLSDAQFTVLGAGGMLGVAVSAYLIADPAPTKAVTAMLAIVPAIAASGSSRQVITSLTAGAVVLATTLSWTELGSSGVESAVVTSGAAATTVVVPVILIAGLRRTLMVVNRQLTAVNQQLSEANDRLIDANRELAALAETDPLTGLLNRRGLLSKSAELLARAQAQRTPIVVHVIDIDHFKSVNDSFGHSAGDAALMSVADALRRSVADSAAPDVVLARTGGDEFLITALEPSERALHGRAEDPRPAAVALPKSIMENVRTRCAVTVSVGTVQLHYRAQHSQRRRFAGQPAPDERTTAFAFTDPFPVTTVSSEPEAAVNTVERILDEVMHAADEALYLAKAAGRDCTHLGARLFVEHDEIFTIDREPNSARAQFRP